MRLSRAISLLAAGAAAAWAVDRQRRAEAPAALPQSPIRSPQSPVPAPEATPAPPEPVPAEPEPEAPEPGFLSSEQPTLEQPTVDEAEPVDVHSVVDDLVAPTGGEAIVDADVVDEAEPLSDDQLAASVRRTLARDPHIPVGAVNVEVADGLVSLRGEIDSPGLIGELERRVQEIDGVERVRNLLHLPGTPSPG